MTDYTSAVLILPAAYRQAGNNLSASMGWQPVGADPGTYSIPLCALADPTIVTHWGCRADVLQSFIDMVENPAPEVQFLVSVLIYDWRVTGDPHGHFVDVIAGHGLTFVPEPEI